MAQKAVQKHLTLSLILVFAGSMLAGQAGAETRIESVLGTVTKTQALTNSLVRKIPTEENVCTEEDVPIYAQAEESGSELGSMIVGSLIGSAIGNKLSDKDGAGTAGAVAGALIGRDKAKKNAKQGKLIGYERKTLCETKTIYITEAVEEIIGYQITIEADDRILKLTTDDNYAVGERIELVKETSYSLR